MLTQVSEQAQTCPLRVSGTLDATQTRIGGTFGWAPLRIAGQARFGTCVTLLKQ